MFEIILLVVFVIITLVLWAGVIAIGRHYFENKDK